MQPRIFISHSAKDHETNAVLQALERKLTEDGFDVLIDRTRLRVEGTGTDWPTTLNQWLEICHGAVLLVSPHALISEWVRNEVIILGFRLKTSGYKFPFLIVHTAGTTPDQIAGAKFGITSLDKLQSVQTDVDTTAIERARELFTPLRVSLEASESADLCYNISTELEDCSEESSVRAGRLYDNDLSRWHPRLEGKRHALANLLMGSRLDNAASALCQIPTKHCPEPANIINLLEPSWADARSVGWLIDEFTKEPPPQVAIVQASYVETITCHLIRAMRRSSSQMWIRCLVPKLGDREPEDTLSYITDWFAKKMSIHHEGKKEMLATIRSAIERKAERRSPVVFIFRSPLDYHALHSALQESFGRVYSIVLDDGSTNQFAKMPYLEGRLEQAYRQDLEDARLTLLSRE